jgi:hypothetical protein
MTKSRKPVWFGKKRVGLGIRPTHPIGWILTTALVITFVTGTHLIIALGSLSKGLTVMISSAIIYALSVALTFG